MNISISTLLEYFSYLSQLLNVLPAAWLCYLPMRNRLRFTRKRTVALCIMIFIPFALIAALICMIWKLDMNYVLLPSLVLLFLFYCRSVKARLCCSLSIFLGVCTLMTFPSQLSYGFDAWLHPDSGSAEFSTEAALFQLAVCCLIAGALAVPCVKIYAQLVDRMSDSTVWRSLLLAHGILFAANIFMTPHYYSTLYVGRVFPMFIMLEIVMLFFFLFVHVIFYHISDEMIKHMELAQRSRILEMQADQYQVLQNHMQQTRLMRHDFRHSVHLLSGLAEEGDISGMRAYLHEYEQRLGAEAPENFCSNSALNALFNYYKSMANDQGIETFWQIALPEPLTVSELDMSSLMGNLMENAIAGCATAPEGERRFALSIEARQGNFLYIVSTNSFDGKPRKIAGGYMSTKREGQGLGLLSISTVAEKYNGYARMSHEGKMFMVDVMIRI